MRSRAPWSVSMKWKSPASTERRIDRKLVPASVAACSGVIIRVCRGHFGHQADTAREVALMITVSSISNLISVLLIIKMVLTVSE